MMLQVPVPPVPPLPPITPDVVIAGGFPPPWVTLPPFVIVLSFIAMCAAAAVVLYPLMRAIGRRIEGRGVDPALQQEVDELRARVHELEAGQARFSELEERLDFAERLLAQRQSEQLPRG